MDLTQKLIVIGLLLLATLATGFGKSWKLPITGLHKTVALAWVIFTCVVVYHAGRPVETRTAFWAVIAVLGVSIVALIASGSFLTIPSIDPTAWLVLHRIATVFAVAAFIFTVRLFVLNKR
ncbi:MAG: hypothetical protein ACLQGT_13970 [Terracidiphilus sp.]